MVAGRAGRLVADASFLIDLGGKLPPGQFTLLAEIIVNGNAMNAEIKRIPIVIHPLHEECGRRETPNVPGKRKRSVPI